MHKGLSLIELLVALSIGAIIMVFALPGFESIIRHNQAQQLAGEWASALRYARSEAIQRAHGVSICPSANTDYSSCGSNWSMGWIIFPNENEDTVMNNDDTEFPLRVHRQLSNNLTLTAQPSNTLITFSSRGFVDTADVGTVFSIQANGCSGPNLHRITLLLNGDISVSTDNCP
tara:strand:+ start:914 stop:1435 length:522 start_codon:yes stop_codon:yes gene_type:complete